MKPIKPGYRGLVAFCEAIDQPLAAYQRRITRAYFGPAREVAAILPRGNLKTHTAAEIGLHNLLTVPGAEVVIGAPSRRQAEIVLDRMKGFCRHPLIADRITLRHWQLRHEELGGMLDVVSADGALAHGFSPSLAIGDEVWAWKERSGLLEAMETGLLKRPDAKVLLISTAAARLDSPLGRLRARAFAQSDVRRRGVVTEARGDLHWLEWSLADDDSLDNMRRVKQANPAPYITTQALRAQREALPEPAFAQFHCNRWGVGEGTWLRPGLWAACAGKATIDGGEHVWAGVDVGGSRAASAVVIVTEDLRCNVWAWQGDDAVLKVAAHVEELARRFTIRELVYDPWRFRSEALRLEERGLPAVEFPQSSSRMVPATERLYAAIVERRLTHPDDETLNRHVANVVAKETPRGWRIDKAREEDQIDAVVALAMAVDRAEHAAGERPAKFLLGWI